ncbi:MAG: SRPBCC family protein [Jatrophihabitantaceae bacterium]
MHKGIVATSEIEVNADAERVWQALTDPDQVAEYFLGSKVKTSWKQGSPITWAGEWKGKPYEDKGTVKVVDKPHRLVVTHFSPLAGEPDKPENYHELTYDLSESGGHTKIVFSQDNNPDEEAAKHSKENWDTMLDGLKRVVEGS